MSTGTSPRPAPAEPVAHARAPRVRAGGPQRGRDGAWPWLFVLPLLSGIVVFYLWPIVQTFYFSFTEWGVFGGSTWTGLQNYTRLITDPDLYRSIGNTLIYTVIVLLGVPVAIYIASLLNTPRLRFASFYRVLFFLPYIAMPTAVAMVWRMIFNGDFGILNYVLARVGIDGPYWTSTPGFAIVAVAIVGLWSSLGFAIIVLGAGLKTIPPELFEAAELDGASPWRRFTSITVPLLTPSIFFVVIVTVIACFQVFDLLYAILGSTNVALPKSMTLVYFFYQEGFVNNQKGYASAIAMAIFLVIGLATLAQFRLQKRWVNSD